MFSYREEQSKTAALDLTYHLAPWDRPIFDANTAAISSIHVTNAGEAAESFLDFQTWCTRNSVVLVSCRLDHDQLVESAFLEARGFRFIELSYRPAATDLARFTPDAAISVTLAALSDEAEISAFAGEVFDAGRITLDPEVGREIGDRRYAAWASNAFRHPGQQVLKCVMDGRIIAFMVMEQPAPGSRFMCLAGMAPGMAGKGLGRRAWRAMLAHLHSDGAVEFSTSISSHNVAVHNLYVSLGFRFPAPSMMFHWCPLGPIRQPAAPIRRAS